MDRIHQLPDTVANQIAAGEVVERPASVIKELVENALDAGATRIDVVIEGAGYDTIQVVDNGCGMSETDARMAFERHATSKISQAQDLYNLHTMGFRGEALPSIAAVAQVTLNTRTADQEVGTCIHIEGGRVVSQDIEMCPVGCNFIVRNLFFNIPVRRKFAKTNQTELSHMRSVFERIALVNPDVYFSFSQNGKNVRTLPKATLHQRIVDVFSKRVGDQLLSLDVDTTLCHIHGYVGRPSAAHKKNVNQYLYVNGRYMEHPYFRRAVEDAYQNLIKPTYHVPFFLYFEVDPASIDVNVHPQKTEIKFENELAIYQIIGTAVRESLARFNAVPTLDFDIDGKPDIPVFESDPLLNDVAHTPRVQVDVDFNPFRSQGRGGGSHTGQGRTETPAFGADVPSAGWESLYSGLQSSAPDLSDMQLVESSQSAEQTLFDAGEADGKLELSNQHFQYHGQYIMTPARNGLMIIEQHRAHVRILYNEYRRQMENHKGASQGLLFPEVVQLPASDAVMLEEMTDDLVSLGFDITSLGGGSFSVQGVPSDIQGVDVSQLIAEMIANAREKGTGIDFELRHRIALTMARSAAIPLGQVLSHEEMEQLVEKLFACPDPNFGPDGRTIVAILPHENLEKLFG